MKYAVMVLLAETDSRRMDFASRECEDEAAVYAAIKDVLESGDSKWQVINVVHIEDLPKLMEPMPGTTMIKDPDEPVFDQR